MRRDAIGFFWEDLPEVKPPKAEKPKRIPPERVWERPDYLPGLQEALTFNVDLYTDDELIKAWLGREPLVWDIECYINYYLIAFRGKITKKVVYFEFTPETFHKFNPHPMRWVLENFYILGFNSKNYDMTIAALACAGCNNAQLKTASDLIIVEEWRPYEVLKKFKAKKIESNSVDIMEVLPGVRTGLKTYAGRTHCKRLQDLPFPPNTVLSDGQRAITRLYCVNDLDATDNAHEGVTEAIHLREVMGEEYGIDIRSRSDAQVAEDIISHELRALTGVYPKKPYIQPGTRYKYNIPHFLQFQTSLMNSVIGLIKDCNFVVGEDGRVKQPPAMDSLEFTIGQTTYRMGIGGLHSCESKMIHVAENGWVIRDADATSFYPITILNQQLFPEHLGPQFLTVYRRIVERRIAAKHAGDKKTADSLKIAINGSYGKFGSMWSILYAPHLIIQVTLTGQLSLLMIIEAFELNGVQCISANTDGIVLKYREEQTEFVEQMIKWWETVTGFEMESAYYKALYSANVNNYIAAKPDGEYKRKGWFGKTGLQKNCTGDIILEALIEKLTTGTPISETVRSCTDIRKFVVLRSVKGGAYWNGQFLGKVVRWYYSNANPPEIIYARNGNLVASSGGGVPVQQLPDTFPVDMDYDEYITRAEKYLSKLGYE